MRKAIAISKSRLFNQISSKFGSHGGDLRTNPFMTFPKEGEIKEHKVEVDWNKKYLDSKDFVFPLNPYLLVKRPYTSLRICRYKRYLS